MEAVKAFGFALAILVLLTVLRQYSPGYAVLTSLAGSAVLLILAAQALQPVLAFVKTLGGVSGAENLTSVFKAVAIALLMQFVQDLCQEAGQTALAGRVELAGKAAVLWAAMPLFTGLVQTLTELLQ